MLEIIHCCFKGAVDQSLTVIDVYLMGMGVGSYSIVLNALYINI